jgi:shikimate dehydrogenase
MSDIDGATLTGNTKIAGVMGWPVSHSLSPRLHGYWLQHYGIDGAYIPLPVRPENVEQAIRALPVLGFQGANVTVPLKEAAYNMVDRADPMAEKLKAVNTIVVGPDGSLEGRNSDGYGFLESLRAAHPGWRPGDGDAVVVGAGGAARSIVVALLDAGVPRVRLVNRTADRAERLASDLGAAGPGEIEILAWTDRDQGLADAGLLINATSLGMAGNPGLTLSLDLLPEAAAVVDIVYNPLETALLAAARARGSPVVDGLGMLLHQARPAFAAWFGIDPEVTEAQRMFVMAGLTGADR